MYDLVKFCSNVYALIRKIASWSTSTQTMEFKNMKENVKVKAGKKQTSSVNMFFLSIQRISRYLIMGATVTSS